MTRAIHCHIALLTGLLGLWSLGAAAPSPSRIAIVAAVSDYNRNAPDLPNLVFNTKDMISMKQVLEAQGFNVLLLQNASASANNLRDALFGLRYLLADPEDSTVLFFFSGHGFAAGNDNYLATYGATVDHLPQKGLAMTEVKHLLDATGAAQSMAFIDVCHGTPYRKHSSHRCFGRNFAFPSRTKVLFSASPGQFSYDDPTQQQGRFAHLLVRGLQGEAAGDDGSISWENLKTFLLAGLRRYSMNDLTLLQMPWADDKSSGDFLIGKKLKSDTPEPRAITHRAR